MCLLQCVVFSGLFTSHVRGAVPDIPLPGQSVSKLNLATRRLIERLDNKLSSEPGKMSAIRRLLNVNEFSVQRIHLTVRARSILR